MPARIGTRGADGRGNTPVPLHVLFPADEPWRHQAACYEHPTLPASTWDDVIAAEKWKDREARIESAKAVCARCPVTEHCLRSVDLEWDEGVRGGIDLRDLRAKKRSAS